MPHTEANSTPDREVGYAEPVLGGGDDQKQWVTAQYKSRLGAKYMRKGALARAYWNRQAYTGKVEQVLCQKHWNIVIGIIITMNQLT